MSITRACHWSSRRVASERPRPNAILALLALWLAGWPTEVHAQTPIAPRKASGRQVALLIGVEKYQKVNPLIFIRNDVQRLAETLRQYGGFDEVVEISDRDNDEAKWPRKATILAAVSKWLQGRQRDDSLFVYFSGHGFRDADGTMYLAPLDADPANLAGTGVPMAWLRDQIARCPAGLKFLVLDACHAGSTKGGGEANIGPQDLKLFEDLEGVITLASSTAEQPSQIWEEKQQSLYSYWLNQGLKGHADEDGNGEINIDELNKYVFNNVTRTAEAQLHRPQTPVRKIGLRTPGQPVVVYLKPQTLKQVLADLALRLGDAVADQKLGKIGVLEFINASQLGERLGAEHGLLGMFCAEQIEEGLLREQRNRFKVVNRRALRQAIQQQQFRISDLGSGEALKTLGAKAGGMPVIAIGVIRERKGRVVTLSCELTRTDDNEVVAVVGGSAWLSVSEWGMLGKSAAVPAEIRRPKPPSGDGPPRATDDIVVDSLDNMAKGPNPMQDPTFHFRVWLKVNGQERKGQFRGNDYLVPLRKGEVYEIYAENRTGQAAMMRLLVDGLNTNLESENVEYVPSASPADKGLTTELIGKHVDLEDARPWLLDPHSKEQQTNPIPNVWAVRGFVIKTGKDGEMARFTVVDADRSLATRQRFTSQIGLITAAFYTETSGARAAGTDGGVVIKQPLDPVKAKVGSLLGVVHIRYYDPDEGAPVGN